MNNKDRLNYLNDEYNREIDKLYAEYLVNFAKNEETVEGAAYARQSTKDQKSIADQAREILAEALRKNIFIRREHIFFDVGVTGRSSRRKGLGLLEALMKSRQIAVALFFTTSRLFRKIYLTLQFVETYTKVHSIRVIFVKNGFDSNDKESEKFLAMLSMIDQFTGTAHVDNVRAAQKGLFLAGYVVGKINFGFQGVEVEGPKTRRGRPRRKLALQPEHAEIVKAIVHKFLYEIPKLSALVRWLRHKSGYKHPDGEWTKGRVKTILQFAGNTGTFFYGQAETVYLSDKNYSLKKLRAQPLAQRHDESLRIIPDKEFEKIRLRFVNGLLGGRTTREDKQPLPVLLNGRMYCHVHDKPLFCTGQSGGVMNCRECVELPAEERPLFSYLPRQHATERLLETVSTAIDQAIEPLVPAIVAECQEYVSNVQSIDPAYRRKLEGEIQSLKRKIRNTYEDEGDTDDDRALAKEARDQLRLRLKEKNDQLKEIHKNEEQPKKAPKPGEVQRKLKELKDILKQAIKTNDIQRLGYANQVLDCVLDKKIVLSQAGEPKSHRGWLVGRVKFRLKQYLLAEYGVPTPADSLADELVIDFRRPRPREVLKQKIFDLHEAARTIVEIAQELKIGDSTVERYLDEIHEELGQPKPTKGERRNLINTRPDKLPFYIQIAPAALELLNQSKLSRGQIAQELNTTTTTLEKAIEHLRKQGHDIPDGRTTNSGRKPYKQPEPPPDLGDDETQERQAG